MRGGGREVLGNSLNDTFDFEQPSATTSCLRVLPHWNAYYPWCPPLFSKSPMEELAQNILSYLEYTKKPNPDAHVHVFKKAIKVKNGEQIHEKYLLPMDIERFSFYVR
jgi:hypothetical protein